MNKYEIGDVWWIHFPYKDQDTEKRRPAIVISEDTIAVLAMYVTSKNSGEPYSVYIEDWQEAGLKKESWTRIDRIISISEFYMDKKIGHLSKKDEEKILQLAVECLNGVFHEFSILAVKNSEGKNLQSFDARWNSWLFPYISSTENNKKSVDSYLSSLLQMEVSSEYVSSAIHCKYSVSDQVYKRYNHKLYKLTLSDVPAFMNFDYFEIGDIKFCWMSAEQMSNNTEIMEKNAEVISFVSAKC